MNNDAVGISNIKKICDSRWIHKDEFDAYGNFLKYMEHRCLNIETKNLDMEKLETGGIGEIPVIVADICTEEGINSIIEAIKTANEDNGNDRNRPYNGQSHTDSGKRGMTEVKGLTMRDIKDCLIKAMLASGSTDKYLEDFDKCWDFSDCDPALEGEDAKPTQFLLDHIEEKDFVHCKLPLGTWSENDVYKLDWDKIDPIAICQNLTCEIEKMMGIYPNIPGELTEKYHVNRYEEF